MPSANLEERAVLFSPKLLVLCHFKLLCEGCVGSWVRSVLRQYPLVAGSSNGPVEAAPGRLPGEGCCPPPGEAISRSAEEQLQTEVVLPLFSFLFF